MGRIRVPQYLLLARTLMLAPLAVQLQEGAPAGTAAAVTPPAWLPARLPSWPWWALRAVLLQQRLLSGLSASLRSLLLGLAEVMLDGFTAPVEAALTQHSPGGNGGGSGAGLPSVEGQLLAAGALLEAALLETAYGHVEPAKALLQRSGDVLGFRSGAWPGLPGVACSWHVAQGMQCTQRVSMLHQLLVALLLTPLPGCPTPSCRADGRAGRAHGAPAGGKGAAAGGGGARGGQSLDCSARSRGAARLC